MILGSPILNLSDCSSLSSSNSSRDSIFLAKAPAAVAPTSYKGNSFENIVSVAIL